MSSSKVVAITVKTTQRSVVISFLPAAPKALRASVRLVCAGLLSLSCACGSADDTGANVPLQTLVYSALRNTAALKDSRLREAAPTQTQGAFGQVKCGDDNGLALDYIAMDSSVTFLDSIPAGSEIIACTLWVKLGALPNNDNDSVVLDLWSVPESWNEDEVTWNSRQAGIDWLVAGGGGQLFETALISVKRVSLFAYEWRIKGALYDTVMFEDALAVPIPIDSTLAQENQTGASFGFALRKNAATSGKALISFITIDNLQLVNRPYIVWVYR